MPGNNAIHGKVNNDASRKRTAASIKNNAYLFIAFVAVILVSLFFRLKVLPILTADPTLTITGDSDSASYLRLFDLAVHNFPKMPTGIDYYSNYPWGFTLDIPPVWPYMLAVAALPLSKLFNANAQQIAGLLVIALGMAAAFPIYLLAKELFGKKAALATAFVALVHPFFILLTSAGIDHITADLFLVPLVFALFLISRRHYAEGTRRKFAIFAVLGGIFIALSIMISLSLILVLSIILLPVGLALFLLSREDIKPVLAALGMQFGTAALVLCTFALTTSWFANSLTFERLSYLHIAVFAAIAVFGGLNYLILSTNPRQLVYRVIIGVAATAIIAATLLMPHFREIILDGYFRSIGSYPLGKNTIELASVFERGVDSLFFYYSYLLIVVPVTIVFLGIKDIKLRRISFEHLFLYAMLLTLGFYAMQSLHYYSPYFSIFAVIVYGLSISLGAGFIHKKLRNTNRGRLSGNAPIVVAVVLAIAVMVFTIKDITPRSINGNLADLSHYLKAYTDAPGDFNEQSKKPNYSVMCYWADACRIQYLSQRATVSSANHEIGIKGIIDSERFYQATSEDEALNIAKKLNVKYVVAGGPLTIWDGDISKIGKSGPEPDKVARALKNDEVGVDELRRLMATRLGWSSAQLASAGVTSPLHRFRLLYISFADPEKAPLKLYEIVKGSRLVLKAAPNSPVIINAVATFANRRFVIWRDSGQTDKQGIFTTVVPYSTGTNGTHMTVDPYDILVAGKEHTVNVSEQSIINGETVYSGS